MRKVVLLLIIFSFLLQSVIATPPESPRILERSFETVDNWTYYESGIESYTGSQYMGWNTHGTYSYKFTSGPGSRPDCTSGNCNVNISQYINMTLVDKISWDETPIGLSLELEVRLNGTSISNNQTLSYTGITLMEIGNWNLGSAGTDFATFGVAIDNLVFYNNNNEIINIIPTTPQITYPLNNTRYYNNNINIIWNSTINDENDLIIYYYQHSIDNFSIIDNEGNTSNLSSGNISIIDGTTNYLRVRAYDLYEYSNWSNTTQFTENSIPTIINISLTPTNPTGTDNLSVSMNYPSDAEGDPLTPHYNWYKNDVIQSNWADLTTINATGNFTGGDEIYVAGFINDTYENNTPLPSNTIIIGSNNSAPTLSGITISPTTGTQGTTITVSANSPITDPESSLVRMRFYRLVDGNISWLGSGPWVVPGKYSNGSFASPWSDTSTYIVYAVAEDSGNATGQNNLTSSPSQATFTSQAGAGSSSGTTGSSGGAVPVATQIINIDTIAKDPGGKGLFLVIVFISFIGMLYGLFITTKTWNTFLASLFGFVVAGRYLEWWL